MKNRMKLAAVACAFTLLLASSSQAVLVLVDDDFESYTSGSDIHGLGPLPSGGTNEEWRTNNEQGSATGTDNIITLGGGGQAYNLTSNNGGRDSGTHDPYLTRRFAPQAAGGTGSDILRFTALIRHNTIASPLVFPANYLVIGDGSSNDPLSTNFTKTINRRAVSLLMKPQSNGQGFILDGGSVPTNLIGTTIEGDWYKILIDLDLDAQTFDISIDNQNNTDAAQHASLTGVAFKNSITEIDTLGFLIPRFTGIASKGNYDIDDVYLGSISAVPEPSSFLFGLTVLGLVLRQQHRKAS